MTVFNNSYYIGRLATLLRGAGMHVNLRATGLPSHVAGRLLMKERKMLLNNIPSAQRCLMVLAHEAGHFVDFSRNPDKPDDNSDRNEIMAYLYGWAVLRFLGCTTITREAWKAHHAENMLVRAQLAS